MNFSSASDLAADVAAGRKSAMDIVEATLAHIAKLNPTVNAFTAVTSERALAKAQEIDAARAQGKTLGPLAGVPFAVKDLFDVKGITTLA